MIVNGKNHKEYFVQQVSVDKTYRDKSRLDFFLPLIQNKKVLHVGFVDWPITKPKNSLHLWLSQHAKKVDGIDVNREGAENLTVPNGTNYFSWNDITDTYDVILVAEVIEHVDNIRLFLEMLDKHPGKLIVTAPDAYLLHRHFEESNNFIEVVHPDHNCYYSPYTLKNTIEKYSNRTVLSLHWIQNHSIAAVCE